MDLEIMIYISTHNLKFFLQNNKFQLIYFIHLMINYRHNYQDLDFKL